MPFGIDTDQAEFLPAAIYYVSDAEVELTAHDDGVGFSCQHIHMIETDSINLVVDVKTFHGVSGKLNFDRTQYSPSNVSTVVLHDHINKVIDSDCLLSALNLI